MKKNNEDITTNFSNQLEPKYPRDTQFLAQYIILANRYEIKLGDYSLLKLEKLIKVLEKLKEKDLLTYYYEDLENTLLKLSKFTGISEHVLFLDLHESLQVPTISEFPHIESLTLNEMLKRLATYKEQSEQRELLQRYYDQYFSKL